MFKALASALPDLLRRLRRADFAAGTDQYLAALDLLGYLYVNEQSTWPRQVRAGLAGIFCTNPDEQERFGPLFDDWFASLRPSEEEAEAPEEAVTAPALTWPGRFKQKPLTTLLPWLVAFALVVILATVLYSPPPVEEEPPQPPTPTPETGPKAQITEPSQFLPPPRRPHDRPLAAPDFYPWWGAALRLLWLLPLFLWLGWTLWLLLHKFLVLKRRRLGEDEPVTLADLTLTAQSLRLFDDPGLEPFWRSLRRFRSRQSKRLDVKATVQAVLRNGGFFEPRYRQRALPPAYLALIDRRHSEDHSAGLARAFIDAMRREHLHVVDRHYRYDPRLSRSAYDPGHGRGPAMLISLYPDHDLLLSGEGEALADPTRTDLSPWTGIFDWWPRKWLLSPAPLWPRMRFFQRLAQAGFRAGALSTVGLTQLEDERIQVAEDDPYDLPLPARLGRDPLRWLQAQGITRKQARSIVAELWSYLGPEGFVLLAATASYPELRWPLTRALDLQLRLDPAAREWRLRKLARLPWFRHAYIPDVIRYAIFARLTKGDIRRLSDAFEALFQHQGDRPLHLPVAIPDWQAQKGAIARATGSAPPGTPLADRVLAAVIRGRRPRQLEFALPFNRLNQRVAQDWRALGLPLLIGALLLPAALSLNLWLWQAGADAWVRDSALARMRSAGAEVQVEIHYLTQTQAYALSLQAELKNRGFSRIALQAAAQPQAPPAEQKGRDDEPVNQIEHGELGPGILSAVRAGFDYITYGAKVNVEKNASMASDRVRLSLLTVPKGFQDALVGLGPVMVSIPEGCFEMGSPAEEPERFDNERQHRVCVEPFMLSRYEITFAEYDAFAEATKRDKPDDAGWGRGRRPVIYVSWEDATAYAAWLSQQTGETYRLPTEAEWEYAARSGTTTPFHTGEQITTDQANFDGNFTYNGSAKGEFREQTVEVGSFPANGFGLYDAHGNVWEWTCSAYDPEYQGGEQKCADADAGERRVLRGGSWLNNPGRLRSAYRDSDEPTFRLNDVGFRLARALP